ncbi:MAG: AarF/ABC1/UbiB kinase family protein [Anaerolineales bacterium]|nr:AarF/ABC1/UbiB kinase family protein [Anaerolineales bacterium]
MASIPRRQFLANKIGDTPPPQMKFLAFKPSRWLAGRRLLLWFGLLIRFAAGTLADRLRGQDQPERRARRLRLAFAGAGGTFTKIGQHLAMRLDFLPWTYSIELSRLRDEVAPFPVAEAIAVFERETGRSLSQAFASFDPQPIVSNAVACSYQAVRHDGRKVVVKVRRPGIGELFMSDALAFSWILRAVEFLTVVRPGYTDDLRREFRETLLAELDFVQEARSQDFFRRAAKKSGKKFFTAPRIHFDLCGSAVIVEEFRGGIWLWELLAALEQNNEEVLALTRQLNIDPVKVARRLSWVSFWGWDSSMFFIANPHPDNIIIGPDSQITYIDFSQVSSIESSKRYALLQNMYYTWKNDALNMARASMVLLEPLPPIDIIDFTKELESHNWQLLYMLASSNDGKSWADRTTALQWLGLIRTAGKYQVNIDFSVLRLIRSMLLSDSLSARLDPAFDIVKAYRRYNAHRAREARRNVTDKLGDWQDAADQKIYLRLERLANTTQGLHFRLRHSLTIPTASFSILLSKWSYALVALARFVFQATVLFVGVAVLAGLLTFLRDGVAPTITAAFTAALASWPFYLLLGLLFLVHSRTVLFRLEDKDS